MRMPTFDDIVAVIGATGERGSSNCWNASPIGGELQGDSAAGDMAVAGQRSPMTHLPLSQAGRGQHGEDNDAPHWGQSPEPFLLYPFLILTYIDHFY
jgi:hypothetical protein